MFRHRAVLWACGSLEQSQVQYCFELAGSLCVDAWAKDPSAILRAQISLEVTSMSASWVRRGSSACPRALEVFKNRFQRLLKTPKIASRRVSACLPRENVLWDVSGMSLGHVWDTLWEAIGAGKTVPKRFRTRFYLQPSWNIVFEGFGTESETNYSMILFAPPLWSNTWKQWYRHTKHL